MKKITFFVSAYNVDGYIKKCLDSFLESKYKEELDVLIINDGSKDKTSEYAHEYVDKYPHIFRIIDKENGGLGSTFNVAVKKAIGEYVISVDADDWIIAEEFDQMYAKLGEVHSDIILFGVNCWRKGEYFRKDMPYKEKIDLEKELKFSSILNNTNLFIHGMAYKVDFLRSFDFKADEQYRLYNDMSWIIYPIKYIETVYIFNYAIYGYRFSESQSCSLEGVIKNRISIYKMLNSLITFSNELSDDISFERKNLIDSILTAHCATGYYVALFEEPKVCKRKIYKLNNLVKCNTYLWNHMPFPVKIIRQNIYPLNLVMRFFYKNAKRLSRNI